MKLELPLILSVGALSLAACKRDPESPAQKPAPQADASPVTPPPAKPPVSSEGRPILSTDSPTPGELGLADGRAAKIEAKLRKIVVEQLGVTADKVVPSARFIQDLGADSLDFVELVMACEEEFNVSIPDDTAEKMATVESTVNALISLGAR